MAELVIVAYDNGGALVPVTAGNPLPTTGGGGGGGGAVTAAAGAFVDGALVTEGTKADASYAGSGSASMVAILKGIYAVAAAQPPGFAPTSINGTVTAGGTAQNASATFTHGFEFINSSVGTYWINGSGVAAANTAGSIPVWPGGQYTTPAAVSAAGTLSIFGTVTSAAFTGRVW